MHVHIDGDILVYRCGFAAEKGEYRCTLPDGTQIGPITYKKDLEKYLKSQGLEPGDCQVDYRRVPEPVENALHNVKSQVEKICHALQPDGYTVYLSGPKNFRDDIATIREYKGNRDPDHKPVHGKAILDYMRKKYNVVTSDAEEADDAMGWAHYALYCNDPMGSVIVTTDKDLDMIPGLHYNFVKEQSYVVDDDYALYLFYRQLLMGDSVDNIVGIPGMGIKRAETYLEGCPLEEPKLYAKVKKVYQDVYHSDWRDVMLENSRLLWIRRRQDQMFMLYEERDE